MLEMSAQPSKTFFIETHHRALLLVAVSLCLLLHLPLAELPLGRDQGIWSSIGIALLDGDIFFKDITHFNLPGLGFAYALAFIFTDNPSTATMLLSLSSSMLTLFGLYFLLKQTINIQTAVIAAMLWAILWPSYLNFWLISQKDVLAIPGLLFSACFFVSSYSQASSKLQAFLYTFLSGICAAICIVFKPVFIVYAFLLALIVVAKWLKQQDKISVLAIRGLALIAGGLSIGIPLCLYIILNGALDKAIFGLFEFAPWYSTENHQAIWFIALKLWARSYFVEFHYPVAAWLSLLVWTPILLLAILGYQKNAASQKAWLLLPTAGALLVYFLQNKGFGYHAAPWQACLLLFVAVGIDWLIRQQAGWRQDQSKLQFFKHHAVVIICLLLSLQGLRAFTVTHYMQHYLPSYLGLMEHKTMLKAFKVDKQTAHPLVSEDLSEWIKNHSEATDRLVIWGQENQIYSMSGRKHSTEHTFDFPLSALVNEATHPSLYKKQQQLRKAYVTDLIESKPRFFIVVSQDVNPVEPEPSNEVLNRVPGLEALLERDYHLIRTVERFEVYQHNRFMLQ